MGVSGRLRGAASASAVFLGGSTAENLWTEVDFVDWGKGGRRPTWGRPPLSQIIINFWILTGTLWIIRISIPLRVLRASRRAFA